MGYWAEVKDNTVVNVIIADQSFIDTCSGEWIETDPYTLGNIHYDNDGNPDSGNPLRKNYACIGYKYNPTADAFYNPESPFPSWVLDSETFLWTAPTAMPNDGYPYQWNEESLTWLRVTHRVNRDGVTQTWNHSTQSWV